MLSSLAPMLPQSLKKLLLLLPEDAQAGLEEIRIREERPLEIGFCGGRYAFITPEGGLAAEPASAYRPDRDVCRSLLELLTNHSVYTFEEELRRGYITVAGGHRVGLAGRTVLEQGGVKLIRDVGSFNIRLARELPGTAAPVLPHLLDPALRSVHHTLIVSPPQLGKTTLLRDLVRLISRGEWPGQPAEAGISRSSLYGGGGSPPGWPGRKVAVVDERSELAACVKGVPRFDLGPRTDVMDGCPKAEGMMMMIRSLSPDVLAVDEIGRAEDAAAVQEAAHAGIRVIATAHGRDADDVRRRPALRGLLDEALFARIVVLERRRDGHAPFRVYDSAGRALQIAAAAGRGG